MQVEKNWIEQMAEQSPLSNAGIAVRFVKNPVDSDLRELVYYAFSARNNPVPFDIYTDYQTELSLIESKKSLLPASKRAFLQSFEERFTQMVQNVQDIVTQIKPLFDAEEN